MKFKRKSLFAGLALMLSASAVLTACNKDSAQDAKGAADKPAELIW